jgi:uncharacterized protein YjbI with pentapeptide repeats
VGHLEKALLNNANLGGALTETIPHLGRYLTSAGLHGAKLFNATLSRAKIAFAWSSVKSQLNSGDLVVI